jgi:hypothetical protein
MIRAVYWEDTGGVKRQCWCGKNAVYECLIGKNHNMYAYCREYFEELKKHGRFRWRDGRRRR